MGEMFDDDLVHVVVLEWFAIGAWVLPLRL